MEDVTDYRDSAVCMEPLVQVTIVLSGGILVYSTSTWTTCTIGFSLLAAVVE